MAQPEFLGKGDIGRVGGEDVVVEGLDGFAADLEDARQPAGTRVPFENPDSMPRFRESERRGQTGEAGADDRDLVIGLI